MVRFIPEKDKCIYSGPSMRSVFAAGDELGIQPIKIEQLKKGDVVVFRKEEGNIRAGFIVHRVINKFHDKLITKGDNNRKTDAETVTVNNLIGKVNTCKRNGRVVKVTGGLRGLWQARLKYTFYRSIYLVYKNLMKFSFFRRIGRFLLKNSSTEIKQIHLNTDKGIVLKWVINGKVIAQKGPGKDNFYVKKPYDLIIENNRLNSKING